MTFSITPLSKMTLSLKGLYLTPSISDAELYQCLTLSVMFYLLFAEFRYVVCRYDDFRYAVYHYANCHYAECHYAYCHYAEGHYAECHYAV
jgi:hypothetical protein